MMQKPGEERSTQGRRLAIGEAHTFRVAARDRYSWSGVTLEEGGRYRLDVSADQTWHDASITCGAGGWTSDELPGWKAALVRLAEGKRRVPEANWFELIGALEANESTLFRIGVRGSYTAPREADLYAFANDLPSMYGNNTGEISVTIERVG
jgi:hypothetical protein